MGMMTKTLTTAVEEIVVSDLAPPAPAAPSSVAPRPRRSVGTDGVGGGRCGDDDGGGGVGHGGGRILAGGQYPEGRPQGRQIRGLGRDGGGIIQS